ncbi:MAG: hypothetical protein MJ149_02785 [Clostridia bacterium]|nr:hypothetical protein [Clostridia bacterium]
MIEVNSILLIYNPNALKGKIEEQLPYIKQRLSLRYSVVETMVTINATSAEELSTKFANKYDVVVAVGGDGTVRQVINGIMKSGAKCLLGVLPCGSCNDVAHSLHIPNKISKAVDCLLRLNTTNYDLLFDGEEYTAYSFAAGYLTESVYKTNWKAKRKFGRTAYVFTGIGHAFKLPALPITLTYDNKRVHDKFLYVMLVNGENTGGFCINKGERLDNGKVKLVAIKGKKGFLSLRAFIRLFMFGIKAVKNNKNVIVEDVSTIEIENHSNAPVLVDGELTHFLKKKFTVVNGLTVIKK